ncbi:MAG: tryptophan synthase subunit alpha [Candidatus Aceula meridiana]|nr:tryptophan synthase subunit alpha [Candidatus Aceula meridiana]
MNRINKKFKELKKQKKKAFIAFITAGDPSLAVTKQLVLAFEKSGVDIVEIGVPFSDPLADGPTIQAASQRALKKGVTLKKILNLVKEIRTQSEIPIALMTYYNPVFHFGLDDFALVAADAGVDGLIIPDLPTEEAAPLVKVANKQKVATVFFISPTTKKDRIKSIDKATSGFIYYVSLTGVTGERTKLPKELMADLKSVKRQVAKPVCVGFGISTGAQVKEVAKAADGVIVGSAIIKEIVKNAKHKDLVPRVAEFVSELVSYV